MANYGLHKDYATLSNITKITQYFNYFGKGKKKNEKEKRKKLFTQILWTFECQRCQQ